MASPTLEKEVLACREKEYNTALETQILQYRNFHSSKTTNMDEEDDSQHALAGSMVNNINFDEIPQHAAIRLFKAHLTQLNKENSALQSELKMKDRVIEDTAKDLRNLQFEKVTWSKQQKSLDAQVAKLTSVAEAAKQRISDKEAIIKDLNKNQVLSLQEKKQIESELRTRDARLSHALNELGRHKELLEQAKSQHTNCAGVSRDDYNQAVADIKRLEQQKQELVFAFKKSMKLVDVLKRQKLHLEAAALLEISGKELIQAMDLAGGKATAV